MCSKCSYQTSSFQNRSIFCMIVLRSTNIIKKIKQPIDNNTIVCKFQKRTDSRYKSYTKFYFYENRMSNVYLSGMEMEK